MTARRSAAMVMTNLLIGAAFSGIVLVSHHGEPDPGYDVTVEWAEDGR